MIWGKFVRFFLAIFTGSRTVDTTKIKCYKNFQPLFLRQIIDRCLFFSCTSSLSCRPDSLWIVARPCIPISIALLAISAVSCSNVFLMCFMIYRLIATYFFMIFDIVTDLLPQYSRLVIFVILLIINMFTTLTYRPSSTLTAFVLYKFNKVFIYSAGRTDFFPFYLHTLVCTYTTLFGFSVFTRTTYRECTDMLCV